MRIWFLIVIMRIWFLCDLYDFNILWKLYESHKKVREVVAREKLDNENWLCIVQGV